MIQFIRLALAGVALSVLAQPAVAGAEPTGPVYRRATLDQLRVEPEDPQPGYWRPRWRDADHDCLDTRAEVLLAEATGPTRVEDCKVVAGEWYDPYEAVPVYDPAFLQIDHGPVALREAWDSGAAYWPRDRWRAFANDLDNPEVLIAVTGTTNRHKSSGDAAEWQPPNEAYRCQFAGDVVDVKAREGLSVDQAEHDALEAVLAGCGR